jgi:hypothetical protein
MKVGAAMAGLSICLPPSLSRDRQRPTVPPPHVSGRVLFSSHLLCLQHFLSSQALNESRAGHETGWLWHADKNAWASPVQTVALPGWKRF